MEKIIVAFESEKTALRVKELLEGGGAAACLVCRTADQVRRAINKLPVPAVVCGYKLGDQTAELFFERYQGDWNGLLTALFSPDIRKVSHNVKDLMRTLLENGLPAEGFVFDTALAAYLLDASASKYNLSELIISYRADAAFTCEKWPDAGALADLFAKMKAEITALGEDSLYNDIEFPLAQVLADMTRTGILVDKGGIEEFGVRMRTELAQVLGRITVPTIMMGGTEDNISSPELMLRTLRALKGSKLVLHQGVDHVDLPIKCREDYVGDIMAFCQERGLL